MYMRKEPRPCRQTRFEKYWGVYKDWVYNLLMGKSFKLKIWIILIDDP